MVLKPRNVSSFVGTKFPLADLESNPGRQHGRLQSNNPNFVQRIDWMGWVGVILCVVPQNASWVAVILGAPLLTVAGIEPNERPNYQSTPQARHINAEIVSKMLDPHSHTRLPSSPSSGTGFGLSPSQKTSDLGSVFDLLHVLGRFSRVTQHLCCKVNRPTS